MINKTTASKATLLSFISTSLVNSIREQIETVI